MEDRVIAIERRLGQLEDELGRLATQVSGEGDELHPGVVGVISRNSGTLGRHEQRLDSVERTIDRFRWTVLGWTAAGSVFGGVIVTLTLSLISGGGSP